MKQLRYLIIATFVVALTVISNNSYAQTDTKRADVRQKAQRARMVDGRIDGEITNREAKLLRAEQRHIRRAERRAKADGEVTGLEKRKLERKQNRASRHIRRAKHNPVSNN
ncbi:MAG TPA: hypothetical protein DIS90_00905 [Cytophagales bacterium]|nr:hypothetical protein [Cytophagales bacterium]